LRGVPSSKACLGSFWTVGRSHADHDPPSTISVSRNRRGGLRRARPGRGRPPRPPAAAGKRRRVVRMATGEHSFVDWLVRRDRAYLEELLRRRADLAVPQPADLTGLAARASTRSSVARAVDRLDSPTLQVLTAA